jgi:pyrroline-5-carboxylate reductase
LGETVWVKREADIDAVTAVSGSGPAYVFLMVEALADAAQAVGLSRPLAMTLARATVSGSGALLAADASSAAADLRRNVTSPGGTTEAALQILMAKQGLAALMRRAVAAARKRARELGA